MERISQDEPIPDDKIGVKVSNNEMVLLGRGDVPITIDTIIGPYRFRWVGNEETFWATPVDEVPKTTENGVFVE